MNRSEKTWEQLNEAWLHFQNYLASKQDRYKLSFVDLIYVSNFKGGNSSITESLQTITPKLEVYESSIRLISKHFRGKKLATLSKKDTYRLKKHCHAFLELTDREQTKIRGFGPSFASALLASYFPQLVPILDRRVLSGARISAQVNSQKQVKNIARHYPALISRMQRILKRRGILKRRAIFDLRQLDRTLFIKPLR